MASRRSWRRRTVASPARTASAYNGCPTLTTVRPSAGPTATRHWCSSCSSTSTGKRSSSSSHVELVGHRHQFEHAAALLVQAGQAGLDQGRRPILGQQRAGEAPAARSVLQRPPLEGIEDQLVQHQHVALRVGPVRLGGVGVDRAAEGDVQQCLDLILTQLPQLQPGRAATAPERGDGVGHLCRRADRGQHEHPPGGHDLGHHHQREGVQQLGVVHDEQGQRTVVTGGRQLGHDGVGQGHHIGRRPPAPRFRQRELGGDQVGQRPEGHRRRGLGADGPEGGRSVAFGVAAAFLGQPRLADARRSHHDRRWDRRVAIGRLEHLELGAAADERPTRRDPARLHHGRQPTAPPCDARPR